MITSRLIRHTHIGPECWSLYETTSDLGTVYECAAEGPGGCVRRTLSKFKIVAETTFDEYMKIVREAAK